MVCEPLFLAKAMHKKGLKTYLYDFNQTILEPIIADLYNISQIGVVHTSEFAYTYGNLSHWNVSGYPFNPSKEDYDLVTTASRTWSAFAYPNPKLQGDSRVLQDWLETYVGTDATPGLYVIGGPRPGYTVIDGYGSFPEVAAQRLTERCDFINDPEFIKILQF